MLEICGTMAVDGIIVFYPRLVGMSYGVADNASKTSGVIVIAKWLCAPPLVLVWTENALEFSIPWTYSMVS